MGYCANCGASLKAGVRIEAHEKHEKEEKDEKHEKGEKEEKHEKGETGRFWMLIGGLILVVLGVTSMATMFLDLSSSLRGAIFLVIVGVLIIIFAFYGAFKASRRSPRP